MSLTPRLDRAEKNFIINGNLDLWQRGTSLLLTSAGPSDKNYLADRWSHTNFFASGSITVSRSVDVPSGLKDATYSMSTAITTAVSVAHATNNYSVNAGVYRMEGYDAAKLHGKTVTLQFWVKSSLTGLYSVAVGSNFDSAIASYVSTYTVNAANTWEQKSVTLLIDSTTGAFAKDNTQGLFIGFGLAAKAGGSRETSTLNQWVPSSTAYVASTANRTDFIGTIGNTIKIAQVKLSIGSQVTDFSTRGETIGDELALCQRYYVKCPPGAGKWDGGGTQFACSVVLPVVLRAIPAASIINGVSAIDEFWNTRRNINSIAYLYDMVSGNGVHIVFITSAATVAGIGLLMQDKIALDAEL